MNNIFALLVVAFIVLCAGVENVQTDDYVYGTVIESGTCRDPSADKFRELKRLLNEEDKINATNGGAATESDGYVYGRVVYDRPTRRNRFRDSLREIRRRMKEQDEQQSG